MIRYNWQRSDWPNFTFSLSEVYDDLFLFTKKLGRISGILEAIPADTNQEAIIEMILSEAIKTSEIEGEYPNRKDVLSSIRKNLGLSSDAKHIKDKSALGSGQLMADVRNTYNKKLTQEKLFEWHTMLLGENKHLEIGKWRSHPDPMQIISGAAGKERIHYEAPPSSRVPEEMSVFITWFNDTAPGGKNEIKKAVVRAAATHLYFETIHPFRMETEESEEQLQKKPCRKPWDVRLCLACQIQ